MEVAARWTCCTTRSRLTLLCRRTSPWPARRHRDSDSTTTQPRRWWRPRWTTSRPTSRHRTASRRSLRNPTSSITITITRPRHRRRRISSTRTGSTSIRSRCTTSSRPNLRISRTSPATTDTRRPTLTAFSIGWRRRSAAATSWVVTATAWLSTRRCVLEWSDSRCRWSRPVRRTRSSMWSTEPR